MNFEAKIQEAFDVIEAYASKVETIEASFLNHSDAIAQIKKAIDFLTQKAADSSSFFAQNIELSHDLQGLQIDLKDHDHSDLRGILKDHENLLANQGSKLDQQNSSISQIVATLSSAQSEIQSHAAGLDSLAVVKDQLAKAVKDLSSLKDDVTSLAEGNVFKITSLMIDVGNIIHDGSALKSSFDSFRLEIYDLLKAVNGKLSDYEAKFVSVESSAKDLVTNLEQRFVKLIEDKLASFKPQLDVSAFDPVKADILYKLDLVALDARNAVVKAGNLALQLPTLEKKIENILLTLKSKELSK